MGEYAEMAIHREMSWMYGSSSSKRSQMNPAKTPEERTRNKERNRKRNLKLKIKRKRKKELKRLNAISALKKEIDE